VFAHSQLSGPSIFPFGRLGTSTLEGTETVVVLVEEELS
jgi:hypothetical protein